MGMNVSAGGKKNAVAPTMNVTPLVDVVLVLLIIFMVVTPLLSKQFWLHLPKKDDKEEQEPPPPDAEKPVVVSVDAKGVIKINSTEIAKDQLKDKLARAMAAKTDKVLYFDAADDAPYGVTVEVMDIARQGGGKTIAILTQKPGS
jgi:biopolymer transport protein ExbD/biopolymer transport protein TolR